MSTLWRQRQVNLYEFKTWPLDRISRLARTSFKQQQQQQVMCCWEVANMRIKWRIWKIVMDSVLHSVMCAICADIYACSTLSPDLLNVVLQVLARAIKQLKEIKGTQFWKEEVEVSLLVDCMIVHIVTLKISPWNSYSWWTFSTKYS